MYFNYLDKADPEISAAIKREIGRQETKIEMIASENFVNYEIMEAAGSALTNKYAEGYPGKRYYGGCEFVDEVEAMAIERAKALFGADHANVQPHCGANANTAVYQAVLEYGDTVLGMDLSNGGHLSHGSPVNISGKSYNFVPYGLNPETEKIDFDNVRELALKHKPKLIVAGASAYPRTIETDKFKAIADEVGAILMVDMAHIAGLVATGHHPNPMEYADIVTSTTHKTLRGPRGGLILCKEKYAKAIDKAIFPGTQGGPLMHIIAAKAVCFKEAAEPEFKIYQQQVIDNAQALAKALIAKGFDLVSGGTDNHLVLVNLVGKNLTGKRAENLLDEANITTNKNAVPNDPQSPFVTSGLRLGTPAMTSRGFKEEDVEKTVEAMALVLDNPDDPKAMEQAKAIVKEGGEAVFCLCDVGNEADVQAALDTAARTYGKLDIVVNNAGWQLNKTLLETTAEEFNAVLNTNLTSMFLFTKGAANMFIAQKTGGAIVNLCSTFAVVGSPGYVAYHASKGGVASFTRAAAISLMPHNIRVNAVGPGTTETPGLHDGAKDTGDEAKGMASFLALQPLKRFGKPEEIASVIAFLASDEASFVTGALWMADGGYTIV